MQKLLSVFILILSTFITYKGLDMLFGISLFFYTANGLSAYTMQYASIVENNLIPKSDSPSMGGVDPRLLLSIIEIIHRNNIVEATGIARPGLSPASVICASSDTIETVLPQLKNDTSASIACGATVLMQLDIGLIENRLTKYFTGEETSSDPIIQKLVKDTTELYQFLLQHSG